MTDLVSKASSKSGKRNPKVDNVNLVNSIEQDQVDELYELDDWGSSWKICKEHGLKWGGRGFGGRAAGRQTVQARDVVIEGCTMAYLGINLLDRTTVRLLHKHRYGLIGRNGVGKSTLMRRIASGTLPGFPRHLRVAQVRQELPVVDPSAPLTPIQYILANDPVRSAILKKIAQIENEESSSEEESGDAETEAEEEEKFDSDGEAKGKVKSIAKPARKQEKKKMSLEEEADFLQSLYDMLEDENRVTQRATKILKDLGFNAKRREADMRQMSGGWRMRVSIAAALTQEPDILLLDEPTNHLDLEGVEWLRSYLTSPAAEDITCLITSHDSNFLDAVCTDIVRLFQQKLTYFVGNYSAYEQQHGEKELNSARNQDKLDKQRKHLEDQIQRMQVTASKDASGKASGSVASRKKKLMRHGLEKNAHGHRFRAQQDSYNGISSGIREGSMDEVALGRKTHLSRTLVEAADREWSMKLPDPIPLALADGSSCLQLRSATMGFPVHTEGSKGEPSGSNSPVSASQPVTKTVTASVVPSEGKSLGSKKLRPVTKTVEVAPKGETVTILENVTMDAHQKSKIAILGKNGCGKSTLMKIIQSHGCESGVQNVHSLVDRSTTGSSAESLPVLINGEIFKHHSLRTAYFQQHQQECLPYDLSPLEYLQEVVSQSPSLSPNHNEQTIRAHLGSFGLSGELALQTIGKLSGGQKARVVLAELTIHRPHILLLDEPTNNLDLDSIRAMKEALKTYQGCIVVASHDMNFVRDTCTEVFHIAKGRLMRLEGGTEEYKELVKAAVSAQKKINT